MKLVKNSGMILGAICVLYAINEGAYYSVAQFCVHNSLITSQYSYSLILLL